MCTHLTAFLLLLPSPSPDLAPPLRRRVDWIVPGARDAKPPPRPRCPTLLSFGLQQCGKVTGATPFPLGLVLQLVEMYARRGARGAQGSWFSPGCSGSGQDCKERILMKWVEICGVGSLGDPRPLAGLD